MNDRKRTVDVDFNVRDLLDAVKNVAFPDRDDVTPEELAVVMASACGFLGGAGVFCFSDFMGAVGVGHAEGRAAYEQGQAGLTGHPDSRGPATPPVWPVSGGK